MTMHDCPQAGYLVPAKTLVPLLPQEARPMVEEALTDKDCDAALQLLRYYWPQALPGIADVFVLTDEDIPGDSMVAGEIYARFEREDLYELKPLPALGDLEKAGVHPSYFQWSKWG